MHHIIGFIIVLAFSCSANEQASSSEAAPAEAAPKEEVTAKRAAEEENSLWSTYEKNDLPDLEKRIEPSEYTLWKCDYEQLMSVLQGEHPSMELPAGERLVTVKLENSGTMSETLAEKFPHIRSFKGISSDGAVQVRVDTNDEGLFAEFRSAEGKMLLSPLLKGSKTYYAVYREDVLPGSPRDETYK